MKKFIKIFFATIFITIAGCHANAEQSINGNNDQITIGVDSRH